MVVVKIRHQMKAKLNTVEENKGENDGQSGDIVEIQWNGTATGGQVVAHLQGRL